MTNLLVYFHGFNSAPDPSSAKLMTLKKICEDIGWDLWIPKIDYTNLGALSDEVTWKCRDLEWLAFSGTSLGGWLADQYARKTSCDGILMNPCLNPVTDLLKHVGPLVNYVTGERYVWTNKHCDQFRETEAPVGHNSTLVLTDRGDDVIPSDEVKARYVRHAVVVQFAGGSHRFEHINDAAPMIRDFLSYFVA